METQIESFPTHIDSTRRGEVKTTFQRREDGQLMATTTIGGAWYATYPVTHTYVPTVHKGAAFGG